MRRALLACALMVTGSASAANAPRAMPTPSSSRPAVASDRTWHRADSRPDGLCFIVALRPADRAMSRLFDVARVVREADDIWRSHGIRLVSRTEDCPRGIRARLRLPVDVRRGGPRGGMERLGSTRFVDHRPALPIALWLDTAEDLAGQRRTLTPYRAYENIDVLSALLGRALAHEVGHVLLGPGHTPMGLMRPRFQARDVAGVADTRFALTPAHHQLIAVSGRCTAWRLRASAN